MTGRGFRVRCALTCTLALALTLAVGCNRGGGEPEDPEFVFGLVDELLESGDTASAIALLERHGLSDTERGLRLSAEAWIMSAEYERALQVLTERIDLSADDLVLLEDACAMGALAALDEQDRSLATDRLAACQIRNRERVDLRALAMRAAGTDPPPAEDLLDALTVAVQEAESGPEVDVAADQLEQFLLELADAAESPRDRLELRTRAFALGQEPTLGAALVDEYMAAAAAADDPQEAATLYEHVYLPARVPGLDAPEAVREEASRLAQDVLFPVFAENFRNRYDRKWAEEDTAAEILDAESATFTFPAVDDDESRDAVIAWLYLRMERPRPTPNPDYLAIGDVCQDPAAPCVFDFEQFARWAYFSNRYDAALEAELGHSLTWP